MECVVCHSEAGIDAPTGDLHHWHCPRCGDFHIEGTAESLLRDKTIAHPGAVSGWIRHQNGMGVTPTITSGSLDDLRTLQKPNFRERAEKFLLVAVATSPKLGDAVLARVEELTGASYSDDLQETAMIRNYLEEENLIAKHEPLNKPIYWRVTPLGHIKADELRAIRAASKQGFVAMWFSEDMDPVYEGGIEPAIYAAGYEPMIIKKKEHANKIDDEIIAEIRRSAFVVADFTGHRGGVYFEAGYAMGRGLPVIWTCQKDDFQNLHFDIRQYNCIDWTAPADLATRLQKRIEALLGRGPIA